ncbi:hypothetical protein A8V01_15980 [Novosphingobium guangzhouense]|uniref:Uncharacterized protein n=1 Tax=Novosphingobium guangzhouense TaxID=1850347 RepID=A0A2K2G366_9SPHN|nr:hypothetical protein A8V01_15980 [Novosphingobium guangzhouense]
MREPKHKARGKRRVDLIRDSAGSMSIPADHGNIVSVKVIGDRMYFIAQRGLTSAVMADHIDPERINADIPPVVQTVELAYGAEDPMMQRTVCAAFELIDPTYLPQSVDRDAVLTIVIEAAQSLALVKDTVQELQDHQADVRKQAEAGELSRGHVPRTPNLRGKVRQCIAALRDVEVGIKQVAGHFYPKENPKDPWDKAFKPALEAALGAENAADQIINTWAVMDRVADHRHAMIHADATKSLTVFDYGLEPDGHFCAPTIEIAHPKNPVPRHDVGDFLSRQVAEIAEVFEALLAHMCDLNVRHLNDMFVSHVTALEEPRNGSFVVWSTRMAEGVPPLGQGQPAEPA